MSNQNDRSQHWQTSAIKIERRPIDYDLESPLKNIAYESSKYIVYTKVRSSRFVHTYSENIL